MIGVQFVFRYNVILCVVPVQNSLSWHESRSIIISEPNSNPHEQDAHDIGPGKHFGGKQILLDPLHYVEIL